MEVNTFDQIWIRLVKIAGFIFGMWIMYHEVVADNSDRPYLYAAALMMMGLQLAETLSRLIEVLSAFLTFIRAKEQFREHSITEQAKHKGSEHNHDQ